MQLINESLKYTLKKHIVVCAELYQETITPQNSFLPSIPFYAFLSEKL